MSGTYITVSTTGCQWTGTGVCPYSWGNCSCGQSNAQPIGRSYINITIVDWHEPALDRLVRLSRDFIEDASKKKVHHAHLIQRHVRQRRPDRSLRFKSKAHTWSTPASPPPKYL